MDLYRSGKTWVQSGEKLTPKSGEETGAGRFGQSVSLSSNGQTLFVGAPEDNSGVGAAWVFARVHKASSLTQEGTKLTANGGEETGAGHFGESVSLSGNGKTAIVGAPAAGSNVGAAWAFVAGSKKSPGWAQQGKKITPKAGEETGSGEFGASVVLESSKAGVALIGAPANSSEVGAAWSFALSGSNWVQHGGELLGGEESGSGRFGESVALSSEAKTALVGGPGDELKDGAAWAFANSEGSWIGSKLTPKAGEEVGGGAFGSSVALSSGGEAALIGADEDNLGTGAAWAFERPVSTWQQVGEKLTGSGSGAALFGASLALAYSSHTTGKAIIGGPRENKDKGAAWPFLAPLPGAPVNTAPPKVSGATEQGDTLDVTHGSWENSPTRYAEQWLRCSAAGSECEAIEGANDDSYLLESADVGHTLRVEETAVNAGGESEPAVSERTAVVTALPLSADAGENLVGCVGAAVTFDGSGSTPASEISKYEWEFGDSSSEEGAILQHTYSSPGSYKATLTVTRGAEHQSDSIEVKITSCTPGPGAGKVTVHVVDTESHPISGAEVLYQAPAGARSQSLTEAAGEATLTTVPPGTATVFAYKSGYRPATGHLTVDEEGEGSTTITLDAGDVAETEAKSHEMTLEEIERAGINPNDPENREVFEFEIVLPFGNNGSEVHIHCLVNVAGELLPPCEGSSAGGGGEAGGGGGGGGAEEGNEADCSSSGCVITEPAGAGGGGRTIVIQPILPPVGPPSPPALQYLILHGNASMLKQFLEVSMGIVNLSPEEPFELTHNKATLNLPAGLSLAPTPTPQSLTQTLGDIKPLGSASASWIIRGDEPGEYLLSADYQGMLEPFEAEINSLASLPTPFHVWGANALKLKVQADEGKFTTATPYKVLLGVEDVANIPLYNVELAIDENFHENFIFQPRQQFSEALGELKPDHKAHFIKRPYILVPDETSVGGFRPELATASFVGEETHPGEGIEAVKPPPLYELSASSTNEDNGLLRLTWSKQEPSGYGTPEGFEIYTTPTLLTPFGSKPVMVRATPTSPLVEELPASATEAYVPGKPAEPLYYAVSTVEEEGHFKLEMRLRRAVTQSPPEFGRCLPVAAGKGKFSSSKCTTLGGKGVDEWSPGAGKGGVTLSGAAIKLETPAKTVVSCKSSSGKGQHASGYGLEALSLTLSGCELAHKVCTSMGATPGEVRASSLTGLLVWEKKASKKAALDVSRSGGGTLLAFECTGEAVEVKGSVLVAVKTGKASLTNALKFKESKGLQKPSEYETTEGAKVKDALEARFAGGSFEAIGLSGTVTLTSEEALEVNPTI